jgi:hypothetical protein
MTSDPAVRPAVPVDAAGIARVHLQAWRECYAHLLPAEALASLRQGPREAKWRDIIAAGTSELWVADENPRAFAFYRRNGFAPDGATAVQELAGTPLRILRMVR